MENKLAVKDVVVSALTLLGRRDIAEKISSGQTLDGGEEETVKVLLYCFNAVEDEVARKYIPLTAKEELSAISGKYQYTKFLHPPVKIKKVESGGKEISYLLYTQYLYADAMQITVEYEYSPTKKELDALSDFGGDAGESLFTYGMAAEYCLINGEIESAELWEKKYRAEIDFRQSVLPSCGTIPPRRWV